MPLAFRDEDEKHWGLWLPHDFGDRLIKVRDRVRQIQERCSVLPQLRWFTTHDETHYLVVEENLHRLLPKDTHQRLTESEKFFLLTSAWLHDLGMLRGIDQHDELLADSTIRNDHHVRSEKFIVNHYKDCGIREEEAVAFGVLARFHRRRCPLSQCAKEITVQGHQTLRLRLLAAYLRLADALHMDQTRSPAEQYAISLAYEIPSAAKLHWLRSKFVIGVDINAERRELIVHLKEAPAAPHFTPGERRKLEDIYAFIVEDLQAEVDSVKDVLVGAGITYFLSVSTCYHPVELDGQLKRDIRTIVNDFFLLDNPSSSALLELILETIQGILESNVPASASVDDGGGGQAIEAVASLVKDLEASLLKTRRCHAALANLIHTLEKTTFASSKDLKEWVENRQKELATHRRHVRLHAMHYFAQTHVRCAGEPPVMNILLYGYSELVIKSLCGFRDAVIALAMRERGQTALQHLLDVDANGKMRRIVSEGQEWFRPVHKAGLEDEASSRFRIFVCEGQPKNRTGWGGRLQFHDGTRYAMALAERGFTEIYVIPDAAAAALIGPQFPRRSNDSCTVPPKIDYVMVGANGFDERCFVHSAGHASVIFQAAYSRTRRESNQERWPKVILTVTTDKREPLPETPLPPREDGERAEVNSAKWVWIDGWKVRRAFAQEQVRMNIFVSQDAKLRSLLERQPIYLYVPREDRIPMDVVDLVITDTGWDGPDLLRAR